uniref:Phage protein n=2 Tax=Bursaphelenchus xylophilus TaxID=6326 RepID=A0A1I7RS13_BURXY
MSHILYEDDYVELTEDFLTIKRYFFPMMKPKVVRVKHIRTVYFDEQDNTKYGLKRTWGKSEMSEVYWAIDFRRCLPGDKGGKADVIVDVEDGLMKGFTVRDVQSFLQSLRYAAPMSLIVVDNLNL